MSQFPGQPTAKPAARSTIYTVLVAIAFVALVGGITFVCIRNAELYNVSPFDLNVEVSRN